MSGKLYIGNLSYSAAHSDLEEAFSGYGQIEEIKVIEDRETGRSRGFAFITFSSPEDADKALEMDGQEIKGRAISVSIARERQGGERERGGGGGGGRNGGGGGGGRFDRNSRGGGGGGRDSRSW